MLCFTVPKSWTTVELNVYLGVMGTVVDGSGADNITFEGIKCAVTVVSDIKIKVSGCIIGILAASPLYLATCSLFSP